MFQDARLTQGKGTVVEGAATVELIAAPGAGKVIRLIGGVITVTLVATGGGGVVSLKDGTTVIFSAEGDATGSIPFYFGEQGYPLTANTALNLVAESAVTNEATAFAAVTAKIVG